MINSLFAVFSPYQNVRVCNYLASEVCSICIPLQKRDMVYGYNRFMTTKGMVESFLRIARLSGTVEEFIQSKDFDMFLKLYNYCESRNLILSKEFVPCRITVDVSNMRRQEKGVTYGRVFAN